MYNARIEANCRVITIVKKIGLDYKLFTAVRCDPAIAIIRKKIEHAARIQQHTSNRCLQIAKDIARCWQPAEHPLAFEMWDTVLSGINLGLTRVSVRKDGWNRNQGMLAILFPAICYLNNRKKRIQDLLSASCFHVAARLSTAAVMAGACQERALPGISLEPRP